MSVPSEVHFLGEEFLDVVQVSYCYNDGGKLLADNLDNL